MMATNAIPNSDVHVVADDNDTTTSNKILQQRQHQDVAYNNNAAYSTAFQHRYITNIFIFIIIVMFLIDIFPPDALKSLGLSVLGNKLQKLQNDLDFIYDKLGLWQGQWTLFSPMPLRVNVRIQGKTV